VLVRRNLVIGSGDTIPNSPVNFLTDGATPRTWTMARCHNATNSGRAVPGPCGYRPRPRGAVWIPRSSCPAGLRAETQVRPTACSLQSANPAFQRESFRHAFTGRIPKIRDPGASSIMAVPSVDSAGAASYGRRWEHEGVPTIATHSAQEFRAQLPCRPLYPRIRTDGKRTAHGVRVVYRGQEARER
jgi:hypothetical protein